MAMMDQSADDTHEIMVPSEYLGDHECKVGDRYQVTAKDDDGSITLKYVGGESEEGEGPMEGMDRYFAEKGESEGESDQGGY